MMIRKAFQYKLRVNANQDAILVRMAGCKRFAWNKALELNLNRLNQSIPILRYNDLAGFAKLWKQSEEYGFLKTCYSQALQQGLKDLDLAFRDAFDPNQPFKHLPRFKKRGKSVDSLRFPQGFKIDQNRVYLPKVGWMKFRQSRAIQGTPKNVTVKKHADGWFVSVQTELDIEKPTHPSTSAVGVDFGVANLAVLSDGTTFLPLKNQLAKYERKLKQAQRALARKVKFSNNWQKQKGRIGKLHRKIARCRHDALHKISTAISKTHAMIAIENLNVSGMTTSAKGTVDHPGTNVSAKSGLNRSILDHGWAIFRNMLEYKQAWRGGEVIAVNPAHTSQQCPECGHTDPSNRLSQSRFECRACGHTQHADWVGARNILAAGHAVAACEG